MIVIVGTLVAIAVPLYLHYSETAKVREAVGMIKAIRTSQKLERIKTSSFYTATGGAASTIFLQKGIDVRDSVHFTYETLGDANQFTATGTATAESDMTGTISYDSATKTWTSTGDILFGKDVARFIVKKENVLLYLYICARSFRIFC